VTAPVPATLRLAVRRRRVPSPGGTLVQVSLRVPSDVGCIEEVIDLLMRHLCSDSWLCRRLRFNLRVAVAEALANAIVAGNQEDRSKWVEVQAELGGDRLKVEITDQGPGFDPAQIQDPLLPEDLDRASGRGLYLIRKLVDDVRFNPSGNSICMTLRRR
jgi:serine/threonine-protein kinase RsbW